MDLRSAAFIFDLDGCVYTGNALVPGVERCLAAIRARGQRVLFLTNNSREGGDELLKKLIRLGIHASAHEILSAAEVAGPFVRERFGSAKVLTTGSERLKQILREAGHTLISPQERTRADVVVVGHDFSFDYDKMAAMARQIWSGAAFVAVNRDPRLPIEGGQFLPGCGAMVAAVSVATGAVPVVIGKPEPHTFRAALARLQVTADAAVMIGDTLDSDIRGGQRAGLHTIWLTPPGLTADDPQPDLTIHHFDELTELLGK
jgi:HAD superfamily hydrolase (TIGR01450 family)